jgi:hypothetical protein
MNKIHTIAHIRTIRMAKSFRSCVSLIGKSQILADYGRICLEEYCRLNRVSQAKNKYISIRKFL